MDLFLTCPAEEGRKRLQKIYEIVCQVAQQKLDARATAPLVMVTRTNASVTLINSRFPRPPVQTILHSYPGGVGALLARFDVDSCCFAYDVSADKLWCDIISLRKRGGGIGPATLAQVQSAGQARAGIRL